MGKRIIVSLLSVALFCLGAGHETTKSGINVSYIDPQVKPCEDFFTHANGNWMKSARQKVGDFFASGMDKEAIEPAGHKPLSSRFSSISLISTAGELAAEYSALNEICFPAALDSPLAAAYSPLYPK